MSVVEHEDKARWFVDLATAPDNALEDLVLGRVGIVAWSRASIREIFNEIMILHGPLLDLGLCLWLGQRLWQPSPERVSTLAWASTLQDVFRGAAGLRLPRLAQLLRERLRDFRPWLHPLGKKSNLDPEAAYLTVLAWSTANRQLEGLWRDLALHGGKLPAHYIDIGLLGLRKSRDEQGALPDKAPAVLLGTLIDLADQPKMAKANWTRLVQATLGGYRCQPATWIREFTPLLENRSASANGPSWLRSLLPNLPALETTAAEKKCCSSLRPPQDYEKIIKEVRRNGPLVNSRIVNNHLDEQRNFAKSTGIAYNLVRTFNRLAQASMSHTPDWAVARAEEALAWERNNAQNWVVLAQCYWERGCQEGSAADYQVALDLLWEARLRFPWNPFVRCELARMYLSRDIKMAIALYQETVEHFPNNVVTRTGLGNALIAGGRLPEAIALYQETVKRFPNDVWARNGLAEALKAADRLPEAIALYQETVKRFPNDVWARNGLAEALIAAGRLPEAIDKLENTVKSFPNNIIARNLLSKALKDNVQQKTTRPSDQDSASKTEFLDTEAEHAEPPKTIVAPFQSAEPFPASLSSASPDNILPAQRIGRALSLMHQARTQKDEAKRKELFDQTKEMLNHPPELMGECRPAFVEAHGFLLLARGLAEEARGFFMRELQAWGTRPPLGLSLGLVEAKLRLGLDVSEEEEGNLIALGPEGGVLVVVVRILVSLATDDEELSHLLQRIYPQVRNIISSNKKDESIDTMLARLLSGVVFRSDFMPVDQNKVPRSSIPHLRAALQEYRDIFFNLLAQHCLAADTFCMAS